MSDNLEYAISDILITQNDSIRVAQSFLKRLKSEPPSRRERQVFVRFLINAGFYREVCELFITWFQEEKYIPFPELLFTLHASGFRPKADFLERIFEAQDALAPEDKISHFVPWENLDPQFAKLKTQALENVQRKASEFKEQQIQQLEYFRTQRMIDEEEKLLNRLIEMYPKDESFQEQKKNFKERWARAIIAQQSFDRFDEGAETDTPLFTADELAVAKIIAESMKDIASFKPHLAYHFAIALMMMELYEHAREVLSFAPVNPATEWLFVEVLLLANRHLECLDALVSIEQKYSDDPETIFGTTYFRARALEGIGDRGTATELLRSLVHIRPNYRSAHALLLKWGGKS